MHIRDSFSAEMFLVMMLHDRNKMTIIHASTIQAFNTHW